MSAPFILRPIATTLLIVAIMLLGMLGYRTLPIAPLPSVDFPTIQVVTPYPGASATVVETSITAPLEHYFGTHFRPDVDELDQFLRQQPDHLAIRSVAKDRFRGAGRAGAGSTPPRAGFRSLCCQVRRLIIWSTRPIRRC